MKKNTKTILIILVLVIVVILLCCSPKGKKNEQGVDTTNYENDVVNVSATENNSNINIEKEDDEKVKEDDEKVVEETKTENKTENKTEDKKEEPVVKEETSISDEDKAISLAKKKYGSTSGVYFRIEQIQSDTVYIVSVRDSETTRDLVWYTVDVKSGTVK